MELPGVGSNIWHAGVELVTVDIANVCDHIPQLQRTFHGSGNCPRRPGKSSNSTNTAQQEIMDRAIRDLLSGPSVRNMAPAQLIPGLTLPGTPVAGTLPLQARALPDGSPLNLRDGSATATSNKPKKSDPIKTAEQALAVAKQELKDIQEEIARQEGLLHQDTHAFNVAAATALGVAGERLEPAIKAVEEADRTLRKLRGTWPKSLDDAHQAQADFEREVEKQKGSPAHKSANRLHERTNSSVIGLG